MIVECFGRLSRKGNYIRNVVIDPQTFETTLFNLNSDTLPKEQLSAGEKQIYRRSNPRVRLAPVIYGGGQERDMRSGTLNVPGIVGFGATAALAKHEMHAESKRMRMLTDLLLTGLCA